MAFYRRAARQERVAERLSFSRLPKDLTTAWLRR